MERYTRTSRVPLSQACELAACVFTLVTLETIGEILLIVCCEEVHSERDFNASWLGEGLGVARVCLQEQQPEGS